MSTEDIQEYPIKKETPDTDTLVERLNDCLKDKGYYLSRITLRNIVDYMMTGKHS